VPTEPIDISVDGPAASLSFNRPNDDADWRRVPVTDGRATIPLDGRVAIVRRSS
jgi:hypothetical protein